MPVFVAAIKELCWKERDSQRDPSDQIHSSRGHGSMETRLRTLK